MWTPRWFVRYVDFPETVRGVTVPNDDGTFDIYISRRLSPAGQRACLEHEIRHIMENHFYSEDEVENLERAADGEAVPKPASPPAPSIPYFPSLGALARRLPQ